MLEEVEVAADYDEKKRGQTSAVVCEELLSQHLIANGSGSTKSVACGDGDDIINKTTAHLLRTTILSNWQQHRSLRC